MKYPNFYETLKEAKMRLEGTVVLYEGRPYYVLCIGNHTDGIFRVYLDDILYAKGKDVGPAYQRDHDVAAAAQWHDEPSMSRAQKLDKIIDKKPDIGVIRKMMNSPHFNKFRPFPLGMINDNGKVYYAERQPTRSTFQGLTQQMVNSLPISTIPDIMRRGLAGRVSFTSPTFGRAIVGDYPSVTECLSALADPRIGNEGAAFHRYFALFRGPLDMLFLAYKSDIVGYLPEGDLSKVVIGRGFKHCREAIAELNIFNVITTKD